jgi:hypothetical protein
MLYPFQDHNEQYGYINAQGEVIVKPCCSFAYQFSDGFAGGVYVQKTKSLFGKKKEKTEFVYFNALGEIAIRNETVVSGRSFYEGLAMVYIKDVKKWGFMNAAGKIVIDPQFDQEYSSGFSEGLVDVCKNEKWGYVNYKGEEVIPFELEWGNRFNDGYAVVTRKKKKIFIDKNGKKLKTVKCSVPDTINGGFKEGVAVVKVGKKYGLINTSGELVIEPIYDGLDGFHKGLCGFDVEGKTGFIDHEGNVVIEPKFSRVNYFHNRIAPASLDNKTWGIINTKGDFILEPTYDFIWDFSRTGGGLSPLDNPLLTTAKIGKNEYYINLQGEVVAETKDLSKLKEVRERKLTQQLKVKVKKEDVWDKAKWAYDGFTITKKGAIKPFYFVLKWLKSMNLLTPEGIDCYKDKNNLGIGLYRFMVTELGADFLDRYYLLGYETESIANFQLDPNLKFEKDENLTEYWEFYIKNKNNVTKNGVRVC